MDFEPGSRIGDYEILSVLGAGGMGKVYKVRNVLSDRIEAMKVVLPALGQDGELTDRFLREIKVQAALDHPNIAALRTAQQAGGQILMIMEYVEGSTVDALLRNGPLPARDVIRYATQVLDALEYAHGRGVVHRDIKPSNIIVTPAGVAKLMDFGIAKFAVDRKLTITGRTLGSLYYMSPEQIQGAATVDARSDVYSLGICLYEMVTGKRPFNADSDYALMVAHLEHTPAPPIEIDPSVPQALNDIILMAIQKDPAQRFQTAAAFRAALGSVPMGEGGGLTRTVTGAAPRAPAPESVPAVDPVVAVAAPAPAAALAPQRSRRGLYMALGSVVTVAILIAAVVFGPRIWSSKHAAAVERSAPAPSNVAPVETVPPVAQQQPKADTQADLTPPPQPQRAAEPAQSAPVSKRSASAVSEPPPVRTAASESAAAQQTSPPPAAAIAPQQENTAPQQSPPPRQTDAAALNQVREQYNQLAIRAGVARSGLQSLQNQMGGLGLRSDMREAGARMDYLMQEARTALTSGDSETARRNIEMAERVVERIEKFLGR